MQSEIGRVYQKMLIRLYVESFPLMGSTGRAVL